MLLGVEETEKTLARTNDNKRKEQDKTRQKFEIFIDIKSLKIAGKQKTLKTVPDVTSAKKQSIWKEFRVKLTKTSQAYYLIKWDS